MSVLMIKRNLKQRAVGFFTNFTYSGEMELDLTNAQARIRFLTSGMLVPKKNTKVDVWLVGGGGAGRAKSGTSAMGSGGGSGYTKTVKGIELLAGNEYEIVIGAGAVPTSFYVGGESGGNTSAFGLFAQGGYSAGSRPYSDGFEFSPSIGGDGASGGGCGSRAYGTSGGMGGSNGADGNFSNNPNQDGKEKPGYGAKISTTEFGESAGRIYAAGGSGGSHDGTIVPGAEGGGGATGADGEPNTGSGGGGEGAVIGEDGIVSYIGPGSGGSGIVIIRKAVS